MNFFLCQWPLASYIAGKAGFSAETEEGALAPERPL